jgi:hypothetical protein
MIPFIVGLAGLSLIIGFFSYDRLVSYQYEHLREDWNAAGGPNGFFWTAPENGAIFGVIPRTVSILKWTFFSEEWMRSIPRMRVFAICMRLGIVGFWLFFVAALIVNFGN